MSLIKVLLIGSEGQLGKDIQKVFLNAGIDILCPKHSDLDITDAKSLFETIESIKPYVVINTASYHDLINCERYPTNAFMVNAIGARLLAIACEKNSAKLFHVSTDYVFSGKSKIPYIEYDLTQPLNVYGNTKLVGENLIMANMNKYYIIRTSGLYGENICRQKNRPNFVNIMLLLAKNPDELIQVTDDEVLTPTYTLDVANQILTMIINNVPPNIYHVTNNGSCSWYEFTQEIFRLTNKKVNLTKKLSTDNAVIRPKYSVLENSNLESLKLDNMRHWKEALKNYLLNNNI